MVCWKIQQISPRLITRGVIVPCPDLCHIYGRYWESIRKPGISWRSQGFHEKQTRQPKKHLVLCTV
jgi:hypothetical protein